MRPRCLSVVVLPLLVLVAGCQTGEIVKRVPVSGGKDILVPLTREGLKPGSGGGYEVAGAILEPITGDEHAAFYTFALVAHREPALKRIQIVDISDETAAPLVDDQNPKFDQGHWVKKTDPIGADDPRMKWLFQITGSMRVYHVTLTPTDGSQIEFNHVVMYPPMMKTIMRERWGEKY